MGDRYTITALASTLKQRFNVEVPTGYLPRFNAAPTQLLPVITQGSQGVSFFYWGQTPERSKNRALSTKLLFAESESLDEKSSSRNALQYHRCLVPIDGYYEWKRISKKGRVAHRLVFGNKEIVGIAGLWEEFEDDNGEMQHTFKIVTTKANAAIENVNSRMPLVLNAENEKKWLSVNSTLEELIPILSERPSNNISMYSVSPKIDDVKNEGEHLIKPFAPADQFGNYSLFD